MTSQNDEFYSDLFDRALALRDAEKLESALGALHELRSSLDGIDLTPRLRLLLAHTHMQLGYVYDVSKNPVLSEQHFRIATKIAPRLELASLGLFHSLWSLDRHREALEEAVRYVTNCDSDGYRELLSEGFRHDLPPAERRLAEAARELLAQFT